MEGLHERPAVPTDIPWRVLLLCPKQQARSTGSVLDTVVTPKDVQVLVPGTPAYVPLPSKGRQRLKNRGKVLPAWTPDKAMGVLKSRSGRQESQKETAGSEGDVTTETAWRAGEGTRPALGQVGDEGMGHRAGTQQPPDAGTGREPPGGSSRPTP